MGQEYSASNTGNARLIANCFSISHRGAPIWVRRRGLGADLTDRQFCPNKEIPRPHHTPDRQNYHE